MLSSRKTKAAEVVKTLAQQKSCGRVELDDSRRVGLLPLQGREVEFVIAGQWCVQVVNGLQGLQVK
jgi:hypothetical protein